MTGYEKNADSIKAIFSEVDVDPRTVRSSKTLTGKQKNDFIKKAMKQQGYSDKEANQMVNQSRKAIKSALSGKEYYDYIFNLGYDSYFKNESYKDARYADWGGEERQAWYDGYSAAMEDERDDGLAQSVKSSQSRKVR